MKYASEFGHIIVLTNNLTYITNQSSANNWIYNLHDFTHDATIKIQYVHETNEHTQQVTNNKCQLQCTYNFFFKSEHFSLNNKQ
jgi:hypothetical protein